MEQSTAIFYERMVADGPTQMAVDQALLARCAADGRSRFRFYRWSPATLSLGYFQDYQQALRQFAELADMPVVRRVTGGGAIIHDQEITYCLIVPAEHHLYQAGAAQAYCRFHQAVIEVVRDYGVNLDFGQGSAAGQSQAHGPVFCFARDYPTDLRCDRGKVVGSAQRRLNRAMLQHGSIFMENRFPQQPAVGLCDLAGRSLDWDQFESRLADRLAQTLSLQWQPRTLDDQEQRLAQKYRHEVHAHPDWIHQGRRSTHRPIIE